ncbi:MAG: hypothetical protein WCH46_11255 [bacterium]
MKKILALFTVLLCGNFLFAGCTVHKDFSVTLHKAFDVNYAGLSYSRTDTLDASKASADYQKYRSDITAVDVQSGTYTVTTFTGSATQKVITGTLTVSNLDKSVNKPLATLSNVTLMPIVGVAQPLTLTDEGKTFLQEQLMGSGSSALLTFSASTNEQPIVFSVDFRFEVKATYSKTIP